MSAFDLRGRTLHTPAAPLWGISQDNDRRLFAATLTSTATRWAGDIMELSFEPGALDLGLLYVGRCPVLIDHRFVVEDMIGACDDAWFEEGSLKVVGRLSLGGAADHVWRLMSSGFAVAVSGGWDVISAEQLGATSGGVAYRVTAAKFRELSIVVAGRNPDAFARRVWEEDVPEMLAAKAKASAECATDALRARLRLDRWTDGWTRDAGARVAAELGTDPIATAHLFGAEVQRHADRLVADLAA